MSETTNSNGKILVVDDTPLNVKILQDLLIYKGYSVLTAENGKEAVEKIRSEKPDLVLLDVMMPQMDGYSVCKTIRADSDEVIATTPIVMVTALDPYKERMSGIEAGADDFLSKPINQPELLARVKSLIRVKHFQNTILEQAQKLNWLNQNLAKTVQEQVAEIDKLGRLKSFFSPQITKAILEQGEDILKMHRRNIAVVFVDMRGFTAFTESVEPEEVVAVLGRYHRIMGELIASYDATLGFFAGDGIMFYFNDPIPIENPLREAVKISLAIRDRSKILEQEWREQGFDLSIGIGFAHGYATLGVVGFENHWSYTCIGNVCNLSSRLCSEAKGGEILTTHKTFKQIENIVQGEAAGDMIFKGVSKPVSVVRILSLLTDK